MCDVLVPIPSFVCLSCYKSTLFYEVNLFLTYQPWLSRRPCLFGFILKIRFLISLSLSHICTPLKLTEVDMCVLNKWSLAFPEHGWSYLGGRADGCMLSVCIHNEASSSLLDAISSCNPWTSFDLLSCSMLYHLRPLMRAGGRWSFLEGLVLLFHLQIKNAYLAST